MTELINFLTSKEIIMVYIVVAVACFLYFIIHLIDKHYYKRKQRHNTKELNRLVENINYELSKERSEDIAIVKDETLNDEVAPTYVEPVLEELVVEEEKEIVPEELLVEQTQVEPVEIEKKGNENETITTKQPTLDQEPAVVEEVAEVLESNNANSLENLEEETLDYTTAEPNQTEAQAELRKLTEELMKAEQESKNIDLTSYEEMQEKEAIISLDELLKRSKEMYENNELTQYADEGNEPISLEDLERKVKESLEEDEILTQPTSNFIEEPVLSPITIEDKESEVVPEIATPTKENKFVMDDFYTIKAQEPKKSTTAYQQYKSMPVISPVYGIEKEPTASDIELENTASYEKLDEEIKKTNEFLMTLKELQEKLD